MLNCFICMTFKNLNVKSFFKNSFPKYYDYRITNKYYLWLTNPYQKEVEVVNCEGSLKEHPWKIMVKEKENIKDKRKSEVQMERLKLKKSTQRINVYLNNEGPLRIIPLRMLIKTFLRELHIKTPLSRYLIVAFVSKIEPKEIDEAIIKNTRLLL